MNDDFSLNTKAVAVEDKPADRDESAEIRKVIDARRIILGPRDKLRTINPVKYPWSRTLYDTMKNNTWFPEEINLSRDKREFPSLTAGERQMYTRALAFLSNLDAIQLDNLAENIAPHITDPTVQQMLHRQVAEEGVHVDSYSTIIETVCDSPLPIYNLYRVDPALQAKNDFVIAQANQMKDNGFSVEQFIYAVVANVVLEGVYFYSGFLSFYTLSRAGKMANSANMIRFIQRDEELHLEIFIHIWHTLRQEHPGVFTAEVLENCRKIIRQGVDLEGAWGCHIIEGGVMGLNDRLMINYARSLGDSRARRLGLGVLYGVKNDVEWVVDYSKVNYTEENFFETKVTGYSKRQLEF